MQAPGPEIGVIFVFYKRPRNKFSWRAGSWKGDPRVAVQQALSLRRCPDTRRRISGTPFQHENGHLIGCVVPVRVAQNERIDRVLDPLRVLFRFLFSVHEKTRQWRTNNVAQENRWDISQPRFFLNFCRDISCLNNSKNRVFTEFFIQLKAHFLKQFQIQFWDTFFKTIFDTISRHIAWNNFRYNFKTHFLIQF